MRIVPALLSFIITVTLITLLSVQWGSVPPMGEFLSPQHGFWLNAEPVDKLEEGQLQFKELKGKTEVRFDTRMVPHIFAENETDAYFVEGYLHAKFRLWQMELQTHVAAGRLSEILGVGADSAILNNDRTMRRLGMVYGAQNSLQEMEKDSATKKLLDAYTAGVNAYITSLTRDQLPFEYRLLNYRPERWSNLKSALFLKYMSYDLTGADNDIELSNARSVYPEALLQEMYPLFADSLTPIVPKGTFFASPTVNTVIPSSADSLYFARKDSAAAFREKPDKDNGSNNWAVSGAKTSSGRPILCNDPHLGLNLPSLWFEIQITTPEYSVYGVSLPGSPSVIIGFNGNIAWGITNAARDVKDFYEIQFKDDTKREYLFNGNYIPADVKIEKYKLKGGAEFTDTVSYTRFGPVMYDENFNGKGRSEHYRHLAVKWIAHDPSNELKTFSLLNRARDYTDYLDALRHFVCPAQNFVFASRTNEIAIWQNGRFPAKWKSQGDFVMPGTDSSYDWQGFIPFEENPHVLNPDRGFVSSANQAPADSSYPYYLGGNYDLFRGYMINRRLENMNGITPRMMQALQNENFNPFADLLLPTLLQNIKTDQLSESEKSYLKIVQEWNRRNDPAEKGASVFQVWFDSLENEVWGDELKKIPSPYLWPDETTLLDALRRDSAFVFIDNINTPEKETLPQVVTAAFKKAVPAIAVKDHDGVLPWSSFKDAGVRHLLRLAPLSRLHLITGGGVHIINATKQYHGQSWKMVVHLTDSTEAYGVYPGGQSGNPGSQYYDSFIDQWSAGRYHTLWFMKADEQNSENLRCTLTFTNQSSR